MFYSNFILIFLSFPFFKNFMISNSRVWGEASRTVACVKTTLFHPSLGQNGSFQSRCDTPTRSIGTMKPTANWYCSLWAFFFELPLKVSKTHLLGWSFHTFIKNVSFSSIDVGSHINDRVSSFLLVGLIHMSHHKIFALYIEILW